MLVALLLALLEGYRCMVEWQDGEIDLQEHGRMDGWMDGWNERRGASISGEQSQAQPEGRRG